MYFNYHAKIKNKIKENKLKFVKVVKKYNKISPAMILYFVDDTHMVVRSYRFNEYFEIFNKIGFNNIKLEVDLDNLFNQK